MVAKKSSGWSKAIISLLLIIPSIFNIATNLVAYVEYEARLAKNSLIQILILTLFAFVLTTLAWGCLMLIVFFWLTQWMSNIATLIILFFCHIILIFIISIMITKTKNKLLFRETRSLFH